MYSFIRSSLCRGHHIIPCWVAKLQSVLDASRAAHLVVSLDFVGEFGGDFSECLFFGDFSDRTGEMVAGMVVYVKRRF
jgi:hypothetical protein